MGELRHSQVADNLCLIDVGGSILEAGFERALLSDSVISERPLPGEGIRLGGRNCDVRIYCEQRGQL